MRSAGESSQQRKSTNEEKKSDRWWHFWIVLIGKHKNLADAKQSNSVKKGKENSTNCDQSASQTFGWSDSHKIMEHLLEESVSASDLKRFETRYVEELQSGTSVVSSGAQFEYAWCLVRSKYPADIRKGILLLEDLYKVRSISRGLQEIYSFVSNKCHLWNKNTLGPKNPKIN